MLVGGFGSIGQPNALIEGLIEQGAKDLTVVANNSGVGHVGLAQLMEPAACARSSARFRAPPIRWCSSGCAARGKIELESCRRARMAERMRAAGAGIPAFYTPTAVGTKLGGGQGRARIQRPQVYARGGAHGDVALVEAWEADRWGNLTYQLVGAQFQSGDGDGGGIDHRAGQHIVELGALDPEKDRDAGHFRRPRAARALRRADGDLNERRPEGSHEREQRPVAAACKPMARQEMAKRVADDIPEGWYVNLGIGVPLQVADYVPQEREVVFQSENGILGMGPAPEPDKINRWLINAGKHIRHAGAPAAPTCITPTVSRMIRGGHLDLCVLGAFQVAENGDIANWSTSDDTTARGRRRHGSGRRRRRIWVMMDHTTKTGESQLVRRCTYPLTAVGVVKRVYTNLAVLDVTDDALRCARWCPA